MQRAPALVSRIMASVRSKNTLPERIMQAKLRMLGHQMRMHPMNVPGRPDIVFPKERVVVFVDGDFWHGRQWRTRGFRSLSGQFARAQNKSYWVRKITRTMARDLKTTKSLRHLGWRVVRVWETDLKKNPEKCVRRIRRILEKLV